MSSKGNVQVVIRFRPFNQTELNVDATNCVKYLSTREVIVNDVVQYEPSRRMSGSNCPPYSNININGGEPFGGGIMAGRFSLSAEDGIKIIPTDRFTAAMTDLMNGDPSHHKQEKLFTFDTIFQPETTQMDIFKSIGLPVVNNVLQGYNGTILSYGQTAAGKSHTMFGPDGGTVDALNENSSKYSNRGIVPRIAETLFERLEQLPEKEISWKVTVSAFELYKENIVDLLLSPHNGNTPTGGVGGTVATAGGGSSGNLNTFRESLYRVREDTIGGKGIYVENLIVKKCLHASDFLGAIKTTMQKRHVAAHKGNDTSSRSHCVIIVTVEQVSHIAEESKTISRLNLVDLAGSEKVAKTEVTGERLKEAQMINLSLSLLGNVIYKLTDGKNGFVPYRNSKLTRILQESFGGNSITTLLCHCSPASYNKDETISTLRFAARAKQIKNKPKVNRELSLQELRLEYRLSLDRNKVLEEKLSALQEALRNGGAGLSASLRGSLNPDRAIGNGTTASTDNNGTINVNDFQMITKCSCSIPEHTQLQDTITALLSEIEDLKSDTYEKTEVVSKLSNQMNFYKFKYEELERDISALKSSNTVDPVKAEAQRKTMDEQLRRAQGQIDTYRRKCEGAEKELTERKLYFENNEQKMLKRLNEIEAQDAKRQRVVKEDGMRMAKELVLWKDASEKAQRRLEDMKNSFEKEKLLLSGQLVIAQDREQELMTEVNQGMEKKMKDMTNNYGKEVEDLRKKLVDTQTNCQQIMEDKRIIESQCERYKKELENVRKNLTEMDNKFKKNEKLLKQRLEMGEEALQQSREELNLYKKRFVELEEKNSLNGKIKNENEKQLKGELLVFEQSHREISLKIEIKEKELSEALTNLQDFRKRLQLAEQQILENSHKANQNEKTLKERLQEIEHAQQEFSEKSKGFSEENNLLKRRIAIKEKENTDKRSDYERIESSWKECIADLEATKKALYEKEKIVLYTNNSLSDYKQRLKMLESEYKQNTEKGDKNEIELKQVKKHFMDENAFLKQQSERDKRQLAMKEEEIVQRKSDFTRVEASWKQCIDDLESTKKNLYERDKKLTEKTNILKDYQCRLQLLERENVEKGAQSTQNENQLKERLQDMEQSITNLTSTLQAHQEQLQEKEKELLQQTRNFNIIENDFEEKIALLEAKNTSLRKECDDYERQSENHKHQLLLKGEEVSQKLNDYERIERSWKRCLDHLEKDKLLLTEKENSINGLNHQLNAQKESREAVEKKLLENEARLSLSVMEARQKLEKAECSLQQLQLEGEQTTKHLSETTAKAEGAEIFFKKRITEVEGQRQEAMKQYELLKTQVSSYKKRLEGYTKTLQGQSLDHQDREAAQACQISALENQLSFVRDDLLRVQRLQEERDIDFTSLSTQVGSLTMDKQELTRKMGDVERLLRLRDSENSMMRDVLKKLNVHIEQKSNLLDDEQHRNVTLKAAADRLRVEALSMQEAQERQEFCELASQELVVKTEDLVAAENEIGTLHFFASIQDLDSFLKTKKSSEKTLLSLNDFLNNLLRRMTSEVFNVGNLETQRLIVISDATKLLKRVEEAIRNVKTVEGVYEEVIHRKAEGMIGEGRGSTSLANEVTTSAKSSATNQRTAEGRRLGISKKREKNNAPFIVDDKGSLVPTILSSIQLKNLPSAIKRTSPLSSLHLSDRLYHNPTHEKRCVIIEPQAIRFPPPLPFSSLSSPPASHLNVPPHDTGPSLPNLRKKRGEVGGGLILASVNELNRLTNVESSREQKLVKKGKGQKWEDGKKVVVGVGNAEDEWGRKYEEDVIEEGEEEVDSGAPLIDKKERLSIQKG